MLLFLQKNPQGQFLFKHHAHYISGLTMEKYLMIDPRSVKSYAKLVLTIVGVIFVIAVTLMAIRFETIKGNQVGVLETWTGGVEPNIYPPKTYVLFPAFMKDMIKYDMSQQLFVMNNVSSKVDKISYGRESDAYLVQSKEGQDMTISLNVRWRLNPLKLIELHKTIRNDVDEKILRPEVMGIVKDEATGRDAIDAYSGDGLVKLQKDIEARLTDKESDLYLKGIIIEGFVIERIDLDPKYISEIKEKQVATQRRLKAIETEKAAQAEALVAKAIAQKSYEEQVVNAKRDKEVGILNAEKDKEVTIRKAEAEKQRNILEAEANAERLAKEADGERQKSILEAEGVKEAGMLKAKSILALGQAEAEANKLKLSSFAVAGSDNYVKTEIAKSMAVAFSGIKGYLPADMKVNLLSESFLKSVDSLMSNRK